MTTAFAVPRTAPDPVADAMRELLYDLLTPERYDRHAVDALHAKLTKHLETMNARARVAHAALTVAGYDAELEAAA